jgi:TRL (tRNA-associated locus)-like protein
METDLRRGMAVAALLACGCVNGLLYTSITTPLTTNMRGTPAGAKSGELDVESLAEPIFTGIRAEWDSNAIGDIARKYGIKEIYYADVQRFSVLLGIFGQSTVRVYGR